MAEVRVENLTKKYGKQIAVDQVSFSCQNGEFFSILGPSGAGKTTILELIAGIKKPDGGRIFIGNRLVNDLYPQERDVAMAFENYSLYPHFTVYENIAFPLRAPARKSKISPQEERKKVEEIAALLGIGDLLDRKPQFLSGGQRQRVSLARALVRTPDVFLLDEPISHLDAKLKVTARTMIKILAKKLGVTIIYVTHDYREALGLSDRVMILREGKIEQIGTPEEVYFFPSSDYVGWLIGDPPINLMDGAIVKREGGTYFSIQEGMAFPLSDHLSRSAEKAMWKEGHSCKVRLGIRPQHVRLSRERASANSFPLPVYAVEARADHSILTFELKDAFLIAQAEKGAYHTGEKYWLEFDQNNIHFFKKSFPLSKMQEGGG